MRTKTYLLLASLAAACAAAAVYLRLGTPAPKETGPGKPPSYHPRQPLDTGGFLFAGVGLKPWKDPTSLEDIRKAFERVGYRNVKEIDEVLERGPDAEQDVRLRLVKASLLLYEGEALKAYAVL